MEYRKFKLCDENYLAGIIKDTWGYDRLCKNAEISFLMGKIYLYSCLCEQNYNLVAVENDKPVGIIMGNIKSKKLKTPLIYKQKLSQYLEKMQSYNEGQFILDFFDEIEKLDKEMLDELGKEYDGELVFFVIDKNIRGKHVGTTLINNYSIELKNNGCKHIFVYTDESCNFGFYEHYGFVRVNKREHDLFNYKNKFFVYEKELVSWKQ